MLSWPEGDEDAVASLAALLARWLRINVPPFLLAAASPRITAPTANAVSIGRLIANPEKFDPNEALVFPAPRPRGTGHLRIRPPELVDSMAKVHEIGAPRDRKGANDSVLEEELIEEPDETTEGENWKRMKAIVAAHALVDTTNHAPAATYQEYVEAEALRWDGSKGDRIKASSLSTYTRNITPALQTLRRADDLRHCDEEFWPEFFEYLRASVRAKTEEKRTLMIERRIVAARRFVKILATLGYNIPASLLEASDEVRHDGTRKSASSTLLFEADRRRTTNLIAKHFAEIPLTRMLAPCIRIFDLAARSAPRRRLCCR